MDDDRVAGRCLHDDLNGLELNTLNWTVEDDYAHAAFADQLPFERAVGTNGAVENLSCGLSVCVGSVRAGSIADHDAWLSRLQEDPGAHTYGFVEAIERTGDQFQSRFVFSTDPALKAILLH
ncbi:hypothetical protein J7J08_06525 [Stenotrophomonas sp. ISL-67]|uniref:hypothetical protein n=1 Tax=Stenotrophomonas sp. ISL-67 TaxID=2819171 RepID=UPI001BE9682A|nr:hypothetical protein [Stenotrophomonas sp. ISL-67]MBT2767287.1 hypothetical protein [Stenotrophomonas sp. ISL-67]